MDTREVIEGSYSYRRILLPVTIVFVLVSVYLALHWAPDAKGFAAPAAQRIMYIHIPMAWVAFLAFGIVMAASVQYLRTGDDGADVVAASSAEIGVVLCTLALITGALWGKEEWGTYWRSDDPKLVTTFVLWLLYMSYVVMRPSPEERVIERDGRQAAVFAILAFVCVPISFISSRMLASFHPNVVGTSEGSLSTEMGLVLLICSIAMTMLYATFLLLRAELMLRTRDFADMREEFARKKRRGVSIRGR